MTGPELETYGGCCRVVIVNGLSPDTQGTFTVFAADADAGLDNTGENQLQTRAADYLKPVCQIAKHDAKDCMEDKQCVSLGLEISQLIINIQEKQF